VIRLEGVGLHGGRGCAVSVSRQAGPTRLFADGASATLSELRVLRADQGVTVSLGDGGPAVDLVEHLLAAIGGLRLWRGLAIDVQGGEVPLLDGGSRRLAEALSTLGLPASAPTLTIARRFSIDLDGARYELTPSSCIEVSSTIDFDHPSIGRRVASWHGDGADFARRVAPARTFGFVRDHAALLAAGRARGVDLASVVVFGDDAIAPSPPSDPDEPARHKLLDLIGDLTLFGGPPQGIVRATRPGHARTHTALRAALDAGALVEHAEAPWSAAPS
jgi:UDP-3-O-[3-hydroxymyristoyl] N-acetylglucosamine deacetylase